ncbi:MAG: hypothetical protein KGQ62_03175 [Gammaproteobacteria bacterium]|nr:hypothetical protein [Gammaproteobacteria bacterium]
MDDEKQAIERATAEGFLLHYNREHGTDYRVDSVAGPGISPDVECINSAKAILWIEITMTEDSFGDIKSALGRSEHKSFSATRIHLSEVKEGKGEIPFNQLDGNVRMQLVEVLKQKFQKRYGQNVALVVRATGVDWDWQLILPRVQAEFHDNRIPFDRGVWLLSRAKNRLYKIF